MEEGGLGVKRMSKKEKELMDNSVVTAAERRVKGYKWK